MHARCSHKNESLQYIPFLMVHRIMNIVFGTLLPAYPSFFKHENRNEMLYFALQNRDVTQNVIHEEIQIFPKSFDSRIVKMRVKMHVCAMPFHRSF